MKIVVQTAPEHAHLKPLLRRLVATFHADGETIYKGRNEIKRINWHGTNVMVKSFAVPNAVRGLIYGQLRRSKAAKSFSNALTLKAQGINTPEPLGFVEVRENGLLRQSFYACHEWATAYTVREPLLDSAFPQRTEILQCLGRFAWQLHKRDILHRDFSPGNILVSQGESSRSTAELMTRSAQAPTCNMAFCLVDVNRMRFEPLSLNERMRNFAMLWASDTDLETIVGAYAQASGDDAAQAISLAIDYSQRHKAASARKERLKAMVYR